jgi:hypothetical protein
MSEFNEGSDWIGDFMSQDEIEEMYERTAAVQANASGGISLTLSASMDSAEEIVAAWHNARAGDMRAGLKVHMFMDHIMKEIERYINEHYG